VFDPSAENLITLNGADTDVDNIPRDANGDRVVRVREENGFVEVRIRAAGNFTVTGTLARGELVIGHNDEGVDLGAVRVTLRNANITNPDGPAIRAHRRVDALTLNIASGTTSTLVDTRAARPNEDEFEGDLADEWPNARNATIFTRETPLTISGAGTLNIEAGFAHAVHVRGASLTVSGVTVNIRKAHANGLRARHSVIISGARLNVTSGNKAIRASGSQHGNITIRDGSVISAAVGGDIVHAEMNVNISGSSVSGTAGGGWANGLHVVDNSRTGIRAGGDLNITNGTVSIDAADSGINCSGVVTITGGIFNISGFSRGIRGQHGVTLSDASVTVEMSRVGIHGGSNVGTSHIRISGGTVHINFTQTAFNANVPGTLPDPASYSFSRI
jgi:hypothetical protein